MKIGNLIAFDGGVKLLAGEVHDEGSASICDHIELAGRKLKDAQVQINLIDRRLGAGTLTLQEAAMINRVAMGCAMRALDNLTDAKEKLNLSIAAE